MKIFPSVFCLYHHWIRGGNIIDVSGKLYAVDAFMQFKRWAVIFFVPSVEL
jgi:hypothetical protein